MIPCFASDAICDSDALTGEFRLLLLLYRNNVQAHGPGGQGSYADPSEADPCFGKVVEGLDAVERMHKSDVEPGNFMGMKHNVAIKWIRVLPKEDSQGESHAKTEEQ
jgi:hypothetical protein